MNGRAVAVALGNIPIQDQVVDALALDGEAQILACRTDTELLALLAGRALAGVVLGPRLVGLEHRVLPAVVGAGLPAVLLVPAATQARHAARLAGIAPDLSVLPDSAALADIQAALAGRPTVLPVGARRRPSSPPARSTPPAQTLGRLVAATSFGGQGVSTILTSVGFAYGAGRSVVVADLDLMRPSLVPLVGGDPSLGLAGVVRAMAMGVTSLAEALEQHLQPLGEPTRSPHARLLGGLPLDGKPVSVTADVVVGVLDALRRRADLVLVDVGAVLSPTERIGAVQRAALLAADGVLIVSGADGVSLKRTQDYLARLVDVAPHPEPARLSLVLNRYDAGSKESPTALADFLSLPLSACVAADHRGALATAGSPHPLVTRASSPAARELAMLATALAQPDWPPTRIVPVSLWRRVTAAVSVGGRTVVQGWRKQLEGLKRRPARAGARMRPTARRRSSEARSS